MHGDICDGLTLQIIVVYTLDIWEMVQQNALQSSYNTFGYLLYRNLIYMCTELYMLNSTSDIMESRTIEYFRQTLSLAANNSELNLEGRSRGSGNYHIVSKL